MDRSRRLVILSTTIIAGACLCARLTGSSDKALSDKEYWDFIQGASEPSSAFISDNLVSNELSFVQVVPQLRKAIPPGRAYIGLGPEQNFTYIAATKPAVAVVIDIRRENLLLHLLYKALFELSADRRTFVGMLFSRRVTPERDRNETAKALMDEVGRAEPLDELGFRGNLESVLNCLRHGHGFALSPGDLTTIARTYGAFHEFGPSISYAAAQIAPRVSAASYATLMAQVDDSGRGLSYLASAESYEFVRTLESSNLVVPVVGNVAGPKTMGRIGDFIRSRGLQTGAFYISNVEDYLGRPPVPANGEWRTFCRNAAALPSDVESMFVRPLGLAVIQAEGLVQASSEMVVSSVKPTKTLLVSNMPSSLASIVRETRNCN